VLEFLLSLSDDPKSSELKRLRSISGQLLDEDSEQPPGAYEALDDILSRAKHLPFYKSSEQHDSSQTEYWTPRHPRAQLSELAMPPLFIRKECQSPALPLSTICYHDPVTLVQGANVGTHFKNMREVTAALSGA